MSRRRAVVLSTLAVVTLAALAAAFALRSHNTGLVRYTSPPLDAYGDRVSVLVPAGWAPHIHRYGATSLDTIHVDLVPHCATGWLPDWIAWVLHTPSVRPDYVEIDVHRNQLPRPLDEALYDPDVSPFAAAEAAAPHEVSRTDWWDRSAPSRTSKRMAYSYCAYVRADKSAFDRTSRAIRDSFVLTVP